MHIIKPTDKTVYDHLSQRYIKYREDKIPMNMLQDSYELSGMHNKKCKAV